MKKLLSIFAAGVLSAGLAAPVAAANDYPNRAIRLINPQAAGSGSDIIARSFASELSKELGQSVFVENRAGAGGTIGAAAGAQAAPDGYTLMMTASPLFSIVPHLYKNLSFDPIKDFKSIIVLGSFNNILVVHPSVPAKNLQELIALAKAQPGKLTFGSTGNGTTTHMAAEMFMQMADIKLLHVPYRSGAPAATALLGGEVDMMFHNTPAVLPHIQAGTLRALASTGDRREPALPDVATLQEMGLPKFQASGWFSLSVPSGTPPEVVKKLSEAAQRSVQSATFKDTLTANAFEVVGGTPEDMDRMIKDEVDRWGPIVESVGVTIN